MRQNLKNIPKNKMIYYIWILKIIQWDGGNTDKSGKNRPLNPWFPFPMHGACKSPFCPNKKKAEQTEKSITLLRSVSIEGLPHLCEFYL